MGECIKVYSPGEESCRKGRLPASQIFKENYCFIQKTDFTLSLLDRYTDSNCLFLKLKSGKLYYSATLLCMRHGLTGGLGEPEACW